MGSVYSTVKADEFRRKSNELVHTSIEATDFVDASAIEAISKRVEDLDFTPHGYKLQTEYNWSIEKVNEAIVLYKEWLVLQCLYEHLSFAPSEFIDEFWHVHILDTRKYLSDCLHIKGEFIHHYPYFGLTEQENEKVLESGYGLTKKLYKHHFARTNLGCQGDLSASCGCRSGNGGSCR